MKKNQLMILAVSALLGLSGCSNGPIDASSKKEETSSSSNVSPASSGESEAPSSSTEKETPVSSSEKKDEEGSSGSSSAPKVYDIVANCDEGAKVNLGASSAEKGAEVHFTLTVLDGFKLKSVSAKAGTGELSLTVGLDGDYSFSMPSRGVVITVVTERMSYKFTLNDTAKFVKSVAQKKVGSSSYADLDTASVEGEADEEGETSVSTYQTAEYGAEILLTFDSSVTNYELTGITVNGIASQIEEGASTYSFTMPAKDTSVSILSSYKTVPFVLTDSEHISLSLYSDEAGTKEIEKGCLPYQEVYLKATSSSEDYAVKKIVCSYPGTKDGVATTLSKDLTSLYDQTIGLYKFAYPMTDGPVTIEVTEYYLNAYADSDFVGDYLLVDFMSSATAKDVDSFNEKGSFSIASSGDLSYLGTNGANKEGYAVSGYDAASSSLTLEGTNYEGNKVISTLLNDGKVMVLDTYLDGNYANATYLSLGVKKKDPSATYHVYASQFALDGSRYIVASFYEGDTLIESVLVTRGSTNAATLGVDVEMLEGDHPSDAKSIFRVKKGGETLLSVGYTGEGGAANRASLGGEFGTYSNENGQSLYLNGNGLATYDGKSYGYTLDEDGTAITLTSNDDIITAVLDKEGMAFEVITSEETSFPWYGKSYKGRAQYSANDDDTSYSFEYTVSFASDGNTLSWTEHQTGGQYVASPVAYEVENGNVIKTKFYNYGHRLGESSGTDVTLTYNVAGDYFTAKGGFNGNYWANTKLTLVS